MTPRSVFEHQTVAGLAAVARRWAGSRAAGHDAVGAVPATPIMRWLAERGGPIDRFHQAMLLRVPGGLREADRERPSRRLWIITMRCGCG